MYIFVLGLDHSRSTIIDLALGQKLGAVSLGEVRRTAFPRGGEAGARHDCSCGAAFADCPFWQGLADDFESQAAALMSKGHILIDSSKDIRHYRRLVGTLTPNLTVVTYRQFDDWYHSVCMAAAREGSFSVKSIFRDRRFILAGLRLYARRFRFFAKMEWVVTHLRFLLAVRGPAFLIASDDDFNALVARVSHSRFAAEHHIVRGNRVSRAGDVRLHAFDESDGFSRFLKKRMQANHASEMSFGAAA